MKYLLTKSELITVAEDLEYLQKAWKGGISDGEIRRGSAVLRRLLVEDIYGHAWRNCGYKKQPMIIAPNLILILGNCNLADIKCAIAGGGELGGFTSGGLVLMKGSGPPPPPLESDQPNKDTMQYQFPLNEYLETPCAVAEGKEIKRRELIKYMANIKGGVHLGSSKARERERNLIKKISKLEGIINHTQKDGLLFELLSIGQAVSRSEDARKLINSIREL